MTKSFMTPEERTELANGWPEEEIEEFEEAPGFSDPDNPWWWNY